MGGSLQESGALVYTVVIVYASLLLGKRATLLFAALSIFSQAIVFVAVSTGWVADTGVGQNNLSSLIVTSLLISMMAAFLWIMLDSLERSVERARSSEERWQSLVKNAPVAIVVTDCNGIIRFYNYFNEIISGDVVGKPLLEFVPTIDQARATVESRRVLRSGKSRQFEAIGYNLDGQDAYFSVSVGPIFGLQGEIDGLIYIVLNITENKHREEEIHRLNIELEKLSKEFRSFLKVSDLLKVFYSQVSS